LFSNQIIIIIIIIILDEGKIDKLVLKDIDVIHEAQIPWIIPFKRDDITILNTVQDPHQPCPILTEINIALKIRYIGNIGFIGFIFIIQRLLTSAVDTHVMILLINFKTPWMEIKPASATVDVFHRKNGVIIF